MGKSAVLKDLLNRPAGYMRFTQDGVVIRAPLDAPAQLELVFQDGSGLVYPLTGENGEQHIPGSRNDVAGCFVFRGEELLLVSDEAMRGVFNRRISKNRQNRARESERRQPEIRTQTDERKKENSTNRQHIFAQRRWPPPPCWDSACYLNGEWQEE